MTTARHVVVGAVLLGSALMGLSCSRAVAPEVEKAAIKQVIEDSIGWALTKDVDLMFRGMAQDDDFFIYHPDTNTIAGFDAFQKFARESFLDDSFKATSFAVNDLRIVLSRSRDVAWFSAMLDDFGEFGGVPGGWKDCRWTGVLEKREGRWVLAQMHFSFPELGGDRVAEAVAAGTAVLRDALESGNMAAAASVFAANATLLPPDGRPVSGAAAIQEYLGRSLGRGVSGLQHTVLGLAGFGNRIVRIGTVAFQEAGVRGRGVQRTGKLMELWKRQLDGSWKLQVAIWNLGAPGM